MKIKKHEMYVEKFEAATEFAKQMSLIERKNKVQRDKNTPLWYVECECTDEEFNKIFEMVFGDDDEDYDDYDDFNYYDYNNYYDSDYSVLDGGYDEPSEDDWERSGLL